MCTKVSNIHWYESHVRVGEEIVEYVKTHSVHFSSYRELILIMPKKVASPRSVCTVLSSAEWYNLHIELCGFVVDNGHMNKASLECQAQSCECEDLWWQSSIFAKWCLLLFSSIHGLWCADWEKQCLLSPLWILLAYRRSLSSADQETRLSRIYTQHTWKVRGSFFPFQHLWNSANGVDVQFHDWLKQKTAFANQIDLRWDISRHCDI